MESGNVSVFIVERGHIYKQHTLLGEILEIAVAKRKSKKTNF